MAETSEALILAAIAVVRPLVRRMLVRGVTFGQLERRLRELFVDVAVEITAGEGKQTDSRLSALTGLNRKEIRRLRGRGRDPVAPASFTRSLSASLISLWMDDPKATNSTGRPIAIPYDAPKGPCFTRLAARATSDMGPRALLQVLIDGGAAELRKGDMVALKRAAYVPERGRPEALSMLADDPPELIETMLHNVLGEGEPWLQQKLAYDNLGAEGLAWLRRRLRRDADRFLKTANRTLARHDRDRNPRAPGGERTYAAIGVYYVESRFEPTPLEAGESNGAK